MKKFILFLFMFLTFIALLSYGQTNCETDTIDLFIPETFGKQIPNSSGIISYCIESNQNFKAEITLRGLEKNHFYMLTLSGKPGGSGNNNFRQKDDSGNYIDFKQVKTNENSEYNGRIVLPLTSGDYDVRFFVKDISDNYKIVLYSDNLSFKIIKN